MKRVTVNMCGPIHLIVRLRAWCVVIIIEFIAIMITLILAETKKNERRTSGRRKVFELSYSVFRVVKY